MDGSGLSAACAAARRGVKGASAKARAEGGSASMIASDGSPMAVLATEGDEPPAAVLATEGEDPPAGVLAATEGEFKGKMLYKGSFEGND